MQPNRLYCGIRCPFLSRLEGLYPEIALKNPQKKWLLAFKKKPQRFIILFDFRYFVSGLKCLRLGQGIGTASSSLTFTLNVCEPVHNQRNAHF